MRKISEKTGRSYRRISSRNAESRPCWASATTSASGRLRRSSAGGGAGGIGVVARERLGAAPRVGNTKYAGSRRQTSVLPCFTPRAPATFANARDGVGKVRNGRSARGGGRRRREARVRATH